MKTQIVIRYIVAPQKHRRKQRHERKTKMQSNHLYASTRAPEYDVRHGLEEEDEERHDIPHGTTNTAQPKRDASTAPDYPNQTQLRTQNISSLLNRQDVRDSVNTARDRPRPRRQLLLKGGGKQAAALSYCGPVSRSIICDLK